MRYAFASLEPSPAPTESLAVLGEAMRGATLGRRVRAAVASRSPDEGLALLNAYVAIDDPRLRQAILDVVMAVSPTDASEPGLGGTPRN